MNPNNPVDAQEDFDRDGLTNLQEYQLGTELRKADTDGGRAEGRRRSGARHESAAARHGRRRHRRRPRGADRQQSAGSDQLSTCPGR